MKKMKSALMTAILLFSLATQAQVGIGVSPANINPSAQLDVSSTSKGFLPPRMSQAERNDIPNPAAGLVVWCSNCGTSGEIEVYNGTNWTNMIGGAAAEAAPLAVGQSYQGGKIAYILQQGDPGYDANVQHGLIAAPSDQQSTGDHILFFSNFTEIEGADGIAIGTGNQNTIDIMNGCAEAGIAARICGDLILNGYSDWYLPSKDELNKLYLNIGQGAPSPNTNVGGFAATVYWSSSEYNGAAWEQYFPEGSGYYGSGNDPWVNVRAVRSF